VTKFGEKNTQIKSRERAIEIQFIKLGGGEKGVYFGEKKSGTWLRKSKVPETNAVIVLFYAQSNNTD
jgi:hypothetical protein